MEILQQQPAGQPAQQTQPEQAQQTPEQERAELDKYRQGLLDVHNQLKPQADLINYLKEQGITDAVGLKARFENVAQPVQTQQTPETKPTEGEQAQATSENEELKAEVEKLRDIVGRQDLERRTDRLQNQIKEQIANKPEFSLLSKALDQSIAYNILNEMAHDKRQGKSYEMNHYLSRAEGNLRSFYEKLGGKLDQGTSQPTGDMGQHQQTQAQQQAQQQTQPQVQNQVQPQSQPQAQTTTALPEKKNPGDITFPSLPSTSAGNLAKSPEQIHNEYLEKGRHPATGKIDPDVAFEKDLQVFMRENPESSFNV